MHKDFLAALEYCLHPEPQSQHELGNVFLKFVSAKPRPGQHLQLLGPGLLPRPHSGHAQPASSVGLSGGGQAGGRRPSLGPREQWEEARAEQTGGYLIGSPFPPTSHRAWSLLPRAPC